MIHKVHEMWEDQPVAEILLIDIKGAFNHVSRARLAKKIAKLQIDDNLISWTQSFLTDRWVELVIDGYINLKQKVETEIP